MSSILKYLYDTSTTFVFGPPTSNMDGVAEGSEKSWTPATAYHSSRYSPSVSDVLDIKSYLFKKFSLPVELIDSVIEFAEYWPHTTTITKTSTTIRAQRDRENQFILRSYPLGFLPSEAQDQEYQMLPEYKYSYESMEPKPWLESRNILSDATEEVLKKWESASKPRVEHPCRKIVFTIKSKDQGWGGGAGRGTYNESFTWFDAGLERVSAFRETTLLEAWELAPFPQFRLHTGTNESQPRSTTTHPNAPKPPLVCSLRTILPITISRQGGSETQHNPSLTAAHEESNEAEYHFFHALNPSGAALQKNVTAGRTAKEHTITWSCDDNINPESVQAKELEKVGRGRETGTGEIVRGMKVGDVVTVWAKARYGQWVNHIEEVKIDVYWSV